jgi:hypothetical protein
MKYLIGQYASRLLVAVALSVLAGCITMSQQEHYSVDTTQWRNFYFGRFTFRLPPSAKIRSDYHLLHSQLVFSNKDGKYQIAVDVEDKINKLKTGRAEDTGSTFERRVELENGSVLLISKLYTTYVFHAFFLTGRNTMYTMMADPITAKGLTPAIEKMRMISRSIYFRPPHEAPPADAFAIEAGYTTLDPEGYAEETYMGAQFPEYPATYITFKTQGVGEPESNLLQRFDANVAEASILESVAQLLNGIKVLRKRNRDVNGIAAQEVAAKANYDGVTFYSFTLEYPGEASSNRRPHIILELGTHEVGSDFKSDEEALVFWDAVINSLKPLS